MRAIGLTRPVAVTDPAAGRIRVGSVWLRQSRLRLRMMNSCRLRCSPGAPAAVASSQIRTFRGWAADCAAHSRVPSPRRSRAPEACKGGRAELVGWETKTARLLPRYLHGRRTGPVFLAGIAPAPARQPALADIDPVTGHARLSYRRAAELFTLASGGGTLHQLRHSRLTHLAEDGVQLPILMAKSRHTSLTSLAIYAKPTFDAVAAATAALDPARRH